MANSHKRTDLCTNRGRKGRWWLQRAEANWERLTVPVTGIVTGREPDRRYERSRAYEMFETEIQIEKERQEEQKK